VTEAEARKLVNEIHNAVIQKDQWCKVEYVYRGKGLHQILIKEISIKITK